MRRRSDPRIEKILIDSLPDENVLRSMIQNLTFTIEKAKQVINSPVVDSGIRKAAAAEIERSSQLLKKYETDLATRLTNAEDALRTQHSNKLPPNRPENLHKFGKRER